MLAQRIKAALDRGMSAPTDIILNDSNVALDANEDVPAAVLVAITDRVRPGVILTQRPVTMRKHPGQVAFPGGRIDAGDVDVFAAALREAQEETGLNPELVTIIGTFDQYRTITGYLITPVIGVTLADQPLVANDGEVDGIFEAPLDFLLDPSNHLRQTVTYNGQERNYFELHWDGHRIWGATAAMIVNLSRRLIWA
jgi:8-oxo-dGTP pyrophosphatase MutT (NUDIX family)